MIGHKEIFLEISHYFIYLFYYLPYEKKKPLFLWFAVLLIKEAFQVNNALVIDTSDLIIVYKDLISANHQTCRTLICKLICKYEKLAATVRPTDVEHLGQY